MTKNNFKQSIFLRTIIQLSTLAFFVLIPQAAAAANASLFLFPPSGAYAVGDVFNVYVKIDSGDNPVNAADGAITFNPAELEAVSISKTGSFFTLWTKDPAFSNTAGKIEFGGGTQTAFTGTNGTVIAVKFKSKVSTTSQVNFSSGSVLAADGLGTNVLGPMNGGVYTFSTKNAGADIIEIDESGQISTARQEPAPQDGTPAAPIIVSSTHPEPDQWYAKSEIQFSWTLPSAITGIRAALDNNLVSAPIFNYNTKTAEKKFTDLADGIWYMHLQFKNQNGWGSVGHRKALIDTAPPENFSITVDNENDPANPTPLLKFLTRDAGSGIAEYEIKIDQDEPRKIAGAGIEKDPYRLPALSPGKHTIIIKAVDFAGNSTLAMAEVKIEPLDCPAITGFPATLNEGDRLTLQGTSAYPRAAITIRVKKENEEPKTHEIKTDDQGSWSFDCGREFTEGGYQIEARITDERGAQSGECAKINLSVKVPFLIKIGWLAINYSSIIIILAALIVLLILLFSYVWYRLAVWRQKLQKEADEANRTIEESFKLMRRQIQEEINNIDGLESVSEKESLARERLTAALDAVETLIGKEMDDIQKEI